MRKHTFEREILLLRKNAANLKRKCRGYLGSVEIRSLASLAGASGDFPLPPRLHIIRPREKKITKRDDRARKRSTNEQTNNALNYVKMCPLPLPPSPLRWRDRKRKGELWRDTRKSLQVKLAHSDKHHMHTREDGWRDEGCDKSGLSPNLGKQSFSLLPPYTVRKFSLFYSSFS